MVSIVILIQDRYSFVKRCIDSIIENTKSDYELVLIVQGKVSEEISDYLENGISGGWKGTIAYNEDNTGVTPGRNLGIELSRGDYVLFFDDDAFVDNNLDYIPDDERELDWLERMKKNFTEGVGVVAQTGYYIDPRRKGIFFEAKTRGSFCDVGQGYCFMFSKAVVDKIGKLDPYFGKFWHEESEYALRAKDAGFTVKTSGYVGVHHEGSGSGDDGSYADKYEYMYRKWKDSFDKILVGRDNWK